MREFSPVDVEFYNMSANQAKQGRLYHVVATSSMVYRAKGPSFHVRGKDSYVNRNFASDQWPPEKKDFRSTLSDIFEKVFRL
jgi:hypothetical protein